MKKNIKKIFNAVELFFCIIMGKLFGISLIVKYLRNPNPLVSVRLLRFFGAEIGERTTIKRSVYLDNVNQDEYSTGNFSKLKIGENCYIGDCVYFDLADQIIIGNNVVISGHAAFVTHADCNRSKYLEKIFPRVCKSITIQDGAWIAFRATILAGVSIQENSVVAAHSLVSVDVDERTMVAGLPAKKIRNLDLDQIRFQ